LILAHRAGRTDRIGSISSVRHAERHANARAQSRDRGLDPTQALGDCFATYVQRDLRMLVNIGALSAFERFVRLAAARCGQVLNLSALGANAGVTHTTARKWLR
jgi:hypothetical protein